METFHVQLFFANFVWLEHIGFSFHLPRIFRKDSWCLSSNLNLLFVLLFLVKGRNWELCVFLIDCHRYKIENCQTPKVSFIIKREHSCLLRPYLVWKYWSHWSRKTNSKAHGTLQTLPKIVSKRSYQEECAQSRNTGKCVAPCFASKVIQDTDKLPSFPGKAEFSQTER